MSDGARRERVRAATEREIRDRTRAVLVSSGRDALTLRAIAHELGMTAPALYRYYGSREELLAAVSSDICADLAADLGAAAAAATASAGAAGDGATGAGASGGGALDVVLAACRAFRRWGLAHPAEFELVFGPDHGCGGTASAAHDCGADCECGHAQFARTFLLLGVQALAAHPLPVPADSALTPELRTALTPYRDDVVSMLTAAGERDAADVVTVGAVCFFLQTFARLYGQVALEVLGHFRFAVADAEPLFEAMLADVVAPLRV